VAAVYLVFAAEFAQALISNTQPERLPWYVGLHFAYLTLYTAVAWRPALPSQWFHLYFALQTMIVASLLLLDPELGTVTALFVLLSFQAASAFADSSHWVWVSVFAALVAGPFMFYLGALTGLARALLPIAGCFILAAYITVNREIEAARAQGQVMLNELEEIHRQLQSYAAQVEELTAIEERNRLARELHDSVSQTLFSIALNTRSAQILLERDPSQVRTQLGQLQQLTQDALAQMRGLIAQWRPKAD
jgi:signal transduction histidine kinase